ncbi:MAG: hypothetical protein SFY96_10300 [Planctomycetota bacterium]|nr:hypothetical protein [Planctomycetota bacterium]
MRPATRARLHAFACALLTFTGGTALAWDAHGHRTLTRAALDGLPDEMPAFLRDAAIKDMIASNANEPDRIRNINEPAITHVNGPDHYLNIEKLEQYGLTLETLPSLRYDYLAALAVARDRHPDKVEPYKPERDPKRANEWPGFLPWAIAEQYGRLVSAFRTLRVLEATPASASDQSANETRAREIERARRMIQVQIGLLSHFVGDAAQPLHTTKYHNGWTGANPKGYTESRKFHAYIDGGALKRHTITLEDLERTPLPAHDIGPEVWPSILAHIKRGFDAFIPLYDLQKSGALNKDEGRTFLVERLRDGGGMLRDLIVKAWHAAEPTAKDLENDPKWEKSIEPDPELSGEAPVQPKAN